MYRVLWENNSWWRRSDVIRVISYWVGRRRVRMDLWSFSVSNKRICASAAASLTILVLICLLWVPQLYKSSTKSPKYPFKDEFELLSRKKYILGGCTNNKCCSELNPINCYLFFWSKCQPVNVKMFLIKWHCEHLWIFVCGDPVQGAGNRCVLEGLARVKWGEVPAAGGLPG